jgi:hypothetical protein
MNRGLWFVAGAGAGVYAVTRVRRLAHSLTVEGLRDRGRGLGAAGRVFLSEVAVAREEKETELRERLHLVPDGVPELAAGTSTPTPVEGPS